MAPTNQVAVLVVDDNADTAASIVSLLEFQGCHAVSARDGIEGLALLSQFLPDLVVSDYMMPRMSGADLGRTVREDPRYASLPFVVMSAAEEGGRSAEKPAPDW